MTGQPTRVPGQTGGHRWGRAGLGVEALSPRELQVIGLAANGHTRERIGTELGISAETVKSHLQSASHTVSALNTTHLVAICLRAGVIR